MMPSLVLAAVACAASLSPVEIATGVMMPAMNLGHPDDSSGVSSGVQLWTDVGGRGLDTAFDYHNQDQVAAGVKAVMAKGVGREELFITTKISPTTCSREAALQAVQEDVKELAGIKPDLVLHHFPCSGGRHHSSGTNAAVWQGLQDALAHLALLCGRHLRPTLPVPGSVSSSAHERADVCGRILKLSNNQ